MSVTNHDYYLYLVKVLKTEALCNGEMKEGGFLLLFGGGGGDISHRMAMHIRHWTLLCLEGGWGSLFEMMWGLC